MIVPGTQVEISEGCLERLCQALKDAFRWGINRGNPKDPEVLDFVKDVMYQEIKQENPEADDYQILLAQGIILKIQIDYLRSKEEDIE